MKSEIFFIIEEFNASGGIKILTSIANNLAESGKDITIFIPSYSGKPYYSILEGVKIKQIGKRNSKSKFLYFLKLFFTINKLEGIIVTPNYRVAAIVGSIKYHKNSLVLLIQGDDLNSLIRNTNSPRFVKLINEIMFKISRKVDAERIYVSNYIMSKYNLIGSLIPNYIDDIFFERNIRELFSNEKVTIGTVSTSSINKGFEFFLDCIDLMEKTFSFKSQKLCFVCATQDKALINNYKRKNLEYVSPASEKEMSDFYYNCDIVLSCSYSEGFNLPVLEAMAMGCIVLATKDGGVNDFIENGKNGFLLEDRDANVVIDLIGKIINLDRQIIEIQKMAIEKASYYSKEKFDNAYLNFFKNLSSK